MPAGDVVDQIGEALRHRRLGVPGEQGVDLAGGPAGIEGTPDGLLADAVNRCGPGGFDVGDGRQLVGEVAFQRPGDDDRQIGLQQEMVDRIGQCRRHRGDDVFFGCAGQQHPDRPGERAAADHAQSVCLGEQFVGRLGLQTGGPARPAPQHRCRGGGGVHGAARRQFGEHRQQQPAVQRRGRRIQRIGQGGIRLAVGPALTHQPGTARQVQPGGGQQVPARGGTRFDESVRGDGRRPVGAVVVVVRVRDARRDQRRRRAQFQDQREPAFVDPGDLGQPLGVAHPEAAAAQLGNRCRREGFEDKFDFAQQVDGRARRGRVDVLLGQDRSRGCRRRQRRRPRRLSPQDLADEPRQDHRLVVDRAQQSGGDQLRHRAVGCGPRGRILGPADRRPVGQPLEQFPLRRVDGGQLRGDAGGVRVLDRDLPRIPGQHRRRLRDHPHRVGAPHQPAGAQLVERRGDDLLVGAPSQQLEQRAGRHGDGGGLQRQQRVQHGELQKIEIVGRGLDRLPGLGAGRQRGQGRRRRLREVGPDAEQLHQLRVRHVGQPGAQRHTRGIVDHC